jgi:uncharacterized protein (TIGR03086 family)
MTPDPPREMDENTLHRRTVEEWTSRVVQIGDDQWDDPTPCAEWTVRELVNHVVGEERWTAPLMGGSTIEDVGDSLDGDLLGDNPRGVAMAAAAEAVDAVDAELPRRKTVHLSYGEERAGEYIRQLVADHLVHGWDLAMATGGDTELDEDLVAEVGEWFAEREELYRGAGIVGPRVDNGEDPQARLLGYFGRSTTWTPQ